MIRRATIRTDHDDAAAIAAAVRPDNTAEMDTEVEDGRVVTRVERETTGGLHSTVDDYVVNVDVATTVVASASDDEHAADDTTAQHADHVTRVTPDDIGASDDADTNADDTTQS